MRGVYAAALMFLASWPAVAETSAPEADPVILVRATPAVMAWMTDPNALLRDEPLELEAYNATTHTSSPPIQVSDCDALKDAQDRGYSGMTTIAMSREAVVSDLCTVAGRYRMATFETTEAPKRTLHADVLDHWSAWFQLAVAANVADAVQEAVSRGGSLGSFSDPAVEACGPRAVTREDPWTISAVNACDGVYLRVVGEEYTASGVMHPIVFYHLSATGGTLRVGGYAVVAPHPVTSVYTPLDMLPGN